jgi:PTS system N-acetylglucosamine-specific IIC component
MAATKNPVMAILQRIGRSLMMPIAVLPAGGLLLRLGQPDLLGADGLAGAGGFHWVQPVADVFSAAGNAVFNNLPILFAIGVAIGFARRSDGSTALAALVGYLVFNQVTMTLFSTSSIKDQVMTSFAADPDHPGKFIPALNAGAPNPTGVIGGIVIGITAALLWQRFRRIKLPTWLAFFGGRRFVPIITAGTSLILGVIFGLIWPPIGSGILSFGNWLAANGTVGAGIYGAINRLLIPFGLHHIVNSIVWFTVPTCHVAGATATGDLNCYLAGNQGSGTFMAGFFPVLMFGLPAAALAMWRAAPKHRRPAVAGIMFSAALTAFVTGITEPIEFAFIFIAPVLFAVHIVLTGASMAIASALGMKLGFSFSAGGIDMLINASKSNTHNLVGLIILGLIYAVVYYLVFSFLIRKMNIPTPGREPEEPAAAGAADGGETVVESGPAGAASAAKPDTGT